MDLTPLPSWTRTLNAEDAASLLDLARPGMTLADWTEEGHRLLPQASAPRRRDLLRLVRQDLLDHDEAILDSSFLRLFQGGSPHRRDTLLHGRLAARRPWVERAVDELIAPALAASQRPLAPHDSDLVPDNAWTDFIARHLRPGTPPEARQKTRTCVIRALRDVGVLTDGPQTRVRRGRPEPVAFAWLVGDELRRDARQEVPRTWASTRSFAARLFGVDPGYAEGCLDAGAAADILLTAQLMAQPLLRPGAA